MKIIVLGGAGDVGSRAVEELVLMENVTQVTICDYNRTAAEALHKKLSSSSPSTVTTTVLVVDATNHAALVQAIRGHDVCASALGPFHRFEVPCALAAIEAHVPYCSVCDDWNAAADVLENLQERAKAEGVVVLTGLGATPGLSNAGVRYLADTEFDLVSDVEISCYQPLNAGGGVAVLQHMLFVMSGLIPIWRSGRRVMVRACSETVSINFPKFGQITTWNMGHAEPVTIHRYFPDVQSVTFRMGFGFGSRMLIWPAYLGLYRFRIVVTFVIFFFTWLERLLMRFFAKGTGAVRIDVYGLKQGQRHHAMLCGVGDMRTTTGLSLAVGCHQLGRGAMSPTPLPPGCYAPEGCLDVGEFMKGMMARGIPAYRDVAMTIPLVPPEVYVTL